MKKNRFGKRYVEFKNCIMFCEKKKIRGTIALLPTIYVTTDNLFSKLDKKNGFYPTKIITFTFLKWYFGFIFADKMFTHYIG